MACGGNSKDNDSINADLIKNEVTANGTDSTKLAKYEFEKTEHDFGKIMEGEVVSYSFKFKNVGGSDMLISNAFGSCGCTVPSYPKEPIKPGASGVIDIKFDSNGKQGKQTKTVTLIANTLPNSTVLTITGEVTPKETKQ